MSSEKLSERALKSEPSKLPSGGSVSPVIVGGPVSNRSMLSRYCENNPSVPDCARMRA